MVQNKISPNPVIVLMLSLFPCMAYGQIQLNGSVDMEISSGGKNSQFIKNEIPGEFRYLHLSIAQINAFLFAPVNDNFFFEGRIQMENWGTGQLNAPRIALANITWADPDKNYSISLGRFINPFGFYPKQQLSIDRVFTAHPLTYGYFINISDKRGYWPMGASQGTYTRQDVGLSTIYFAGYATGLSLNWLIKPNKLILDAALTNTAPASIVNFTNLANAAGIVRLQFNPSIFWQQGISFSHGSFMQLDPVNSFFRSANPLEQYRQTLIGADLKLGYAFWEIVGEAVFARWKVPGYTGGEFSVEQGNELEEYNLANLSGNIDIKFEPPFFAGSYIAFRAEHLYFLEADDPQSDQTIKWDEDVTRLTGVFGYKFGRNILSKISFSEQTPFDSTEYAFRIQLTAFF